MAWDPSQLFVQLSVNGAGKMAAPPALVVFISVSLVCSFFIVVNGADKKIPTVLERLEIQSKNNSIKADALHPCVCAIFLSSQLDKNGGPPNGEPLLQHSHEGPCLPNGPAGIKMCTNKCIEMASKHLHNSKEILCAVSEKDIDREKVYLFVKNYEDKWVKTNLSSGRDYCCKNGQPVVCQVSPVSLLLKRTT